LANIEIYILRIISKQDYSTRFPSVCFMFSQLMQNELWKVWFKRYYGHVNARGRRVTQYRPTCCASY